MTRPAARPRPKSQGPEHLASGSVRLRRLGLLLYPKPGARGLWVLPVCAAQFRGRLERLSPANAKRWEEMDLDGVPTMCFSMGQRMLKHIDKGTFTASYARFANAVGHRVVQEFYPELWLRDHNTRAKARNTWEAHHGGIRAERFNRGPSVRACASMSIT